MFILRPNQTTFKVQRQECSVQVREGDIVVFTYEKYSRQTYPVNPKIAAVRKDVSWLEIVKNAGMLSFFFPSLSPPFLLSFSLSLLALLSD